MVADDPVDVDKVLSPIAPMIPARGFIRDYTRWAVTQTDAPSCFHIGTVLTVLSTLINSTAVVGMGTDHQALNLFTLIVGGSGSSRKSTAVKFGDKILHHVDNGARVGSKFGSYEGLVQSLAEKPVLCVTESEFSRFLSQSQGRSAGYLAALKTGITDAYDAMPMSRKTMKVDTGQIKDYRLSMLGAISAPYLSLYTDPEDFTGGFLSRWLFMLGDRDRFLVLGDDSPELMTERARLFDYAEHIYRYSPGGRFTFDEKARTLYYEWAHQLNAAARGAESKIEGIYERAGALTRRIAAIYAIDRMMSEGYVMDDPLIGSSETHLIKPEDLVYAHEVVKHHLRSAIKIVATVAHTKDARDKATILESIPIDPTGQQIGVSRGAICRQAGMLRTRVMTILETLKEEGLVRERLALRSVYYTRVPPDMVPVDPGAGEETVLVPPAPPAAPPPAVLQPAPPDDGTVIPFPSGPVATSVPAYEAPYEPPPEYEPSSWAAPDDD